MLAKEAERKKKREQHAVAEKQAAAEAAEAKRLTEEAKVNATRSGGGSRDRRREGRAGGGGACRDRQTKSGTEVRRTVRPGQTRRTRGSRGDRTPANAKLEALKTAGHTIKNPRPAGNVALMTPVCRPAVQQGRQGAHPTCKKKR